MFLYFCLFYYSATKIVELILTLFNSMRIIFFTIYEVRNTQHYNFSSEGSYYNHTSDFGKSMKLGRNVQHNVMIQNFEGDTSKSHVIADVSIFYVKSFFLSKPFMLFTVGKIFLR